MTNTIAFPQLSDKVFTLNRVAFNFFGIEIMWYGLIIATGFALAGFYATKRSREFGLDVDFILDLLIWCLPVAIVGARAYYVLSSWDHYSRNLGEIFMIRNGGLAFYGSFIAAVAAGYAVCRWKKRSFLATLDLACLGFIIGQSIGRWGNFMNAEAFGTVTNLPWGMSINGLPPVHPTFLYESLWNALGFIILHFASKHRKYNGQIALGYMAWYGFGRMFIEGLRTDSLFIGYTDIRISQLYAFISFIVCAGLLIYFQVSKKYKPIEKNTESR